jgi:hypothetical protein
MGNAKPWQIVLMVVAVVAVAVSMYLTTSGTDEKPAMVEDVTMVDVTTGELFVFNVSGGRSISVPGVHPTSKKRSLLPVMKDESGQWIVSARDLSALSATEGEPTAITDRRTGRVSTAPGEPKRVQ